MELLIILFFFLVLVVAVNSIHARTQEKRPVIPPCPPSPHKWRDVIELDEFGREQYKLRCENCKRTPEEIQ